MFVNKKTKEIVEIADIIAANPNVSLPNMGWSDEMLDDLGYARLHFPETLAPGPFEYLEEGTPVKEKDGKWYRSFTRKTISEDEKAVVVSNEWNKVRELRTIKLVECDWTQVPDSPVNKEEWAIYRQTLRDITDNTTDPFNVVWPNPPLTSKES